MKSASVWSALKLVGITMLIRLAPEAALASVAGHQRDSASLALLTASADAQVPSVLENEATSLQGQPRGLTRELRRLVTPFVWRDSIYYHNETLIPHMQEMLTVLIKLQHSDGTFTNGNRHSPPDTGFQIEDFGIMVRILERDNHPISSPLAQSIREILVKAGKGLAKGGIHTPNHRWKVCAALARISTITNNKSLIKRIDEWLAEGIDIDDDGIYSERSPIYYSEVTNPSLLTVASEIGYTDLIDYVRRNLELTIEHSVPNGEVEIIQSRRQDQKDQEPRYITSFYPLYRELALRDRNERFAAMARLIERKFAPSLGDYLGNLMERPELAAKLPESEEPFVDFDKHYKTAGLVRTRRDKLTVSIFGGTDWYNSHGKQTQFFNFIGSGLSTNPTMFRAWNGGLVLEAIRLFPNFFSMGPFRSDGVVHKQGITQLRSEIEVPYYLPLPARDRDRDGNYDMSRSIDGRFYSKLEFDKRPTAVRRLQTGVIIAPSSSGYDLTFEVSGEDDVEMTLELTFRPGGTLEGAEEAKNADGETIHHLKKGKATYTVGKDSVTFGSGNGDGLIAPDSGEQYSWLGGNLNMVGEKVYITGKTPLNYTLSVEFS